MFVVKTFYIYILASRKNGTLYTGMTNDLLRRVYEHKRKINRGFTYKYGVDKSVYYEETDDVLYAIAREKCIKKWYRAWKIKTICEFNPDWKDLYYTLGGTDDLYDDHYYEFLNYGSPHSRG